MLTRFRHALAFLLLWLLLPAGLIAASFLFRGGLLAVCVYAFWLLLLLARLMIRLWLAPLTCERELDRDVIEVGEAVNVLVRLHNPAPWPILWLYAEETLPPGFLKLGQWRRLLFLPPRRSFYLTYSLTPPRRGCHQIGPLVLESGDVFGLFRRCRIDERLDFVTVLPKYQHLDDFEVGRARRLGSLTAERSIFEDPTRLRGVREYQRGDAMRRIHWKTSARSGRLWSKVFDPITEAAATVILDFHHAAWREAHSRIKHLPAHEMAVEVACTICHYLADGGWKFGFFSNGRDPLGLPGISVAQARASETLGEARRAALRHKADDRLAPIAIRARAALDQFPLIHEHLGRIELSDGLPIEELLLAELPRIEREQALVLLTGGVTPGLISALSRVRAQGYRVLLYVVCNNVAHDRAFEELTPCGVEVHRMDEEWRLNELATGRIHF